MFIRSERLFLRPGWPEDWVGLFSRIKDWTVIGHLMSMAESARDSVARACSDMPLRRFPQFVVTLPSSDGAQAIGCVSLLRGEQGGELVYWIAPEFWGQGYATEAVHAVLGLARTLGHRQITALDLADNAASGRVLAKLGFQATGDTSLRMCPARGALTAPLVHRRDLADSGDGASGVARQAA